MFLTSLQNDLHFNRMFNKSYYVDANQFWHKVVFWREQNFIDLTMQVASAGTLPVRLVVIAEVIIRL